MHKLKQAFGKRADNTQTTAATADNVEPERRRSSILRQIMNPGGSKYDEDIHGTPSTATPDVRKPADLKPNEDVKLRADKDHQGKKEHSILRQVMNPGGKKFDETRHGITAVPVEEVKSSGQQGSSVESERV